MSETCVQFNINQIKMSIATQNSSNQYTLCDGVRFVFFRNNIFTADQNIFSNRHFPLTMKFLLFFTTFCLLFHCYKSDFAAQLDAFISDTVSIEIYL